MKELIEKEGLIIIIRGVPLEKIDKVVNALYDGGVRIAEVAFDPADAGTIAKTTAMIKKIVEVMGDKMLIGSGTTIKPEFVEAAYKAGAKFIISPDTNPEIIKLTKKLGLISIPGAYTPSECTCAYNNGADFVKLFPITVNEIGYFKNIAKPLAHIPFLCFGGTNENTAAEFIKAGAKGVGTCVSVLKPELIETENYAEITRLAKLHVDRIKTAKSER